MSTRAALALSLLAAPALGHAADAHDPLAFVERPDMPRAPLVTGRRGMVVSAQRLASEAGAQILRDGGNAADAAVAVGYALAVVYPAAGNLGGGGFMTLRLPSGESHFIDFREHAPLSATSTMFQDAQGRVIPGLSTEGWKAVGVPGTVAGLELVRRRWGRLSRARDMAPAIALARDGFVLSGPDVALLDTSTDDLARDPAARAIFRAPDGGRLRPGDRLTQPDLARTLSAIARGGPDVFYRGPIAREIAAASAAGGGLLGTRDFARYRPRVMAPLTCHYRGYLVQTAPPPSGGGIALCEMLDVLAGFKITPDTLRAAETVQREIETMRHVYSDRRDLGDPDFVHNPVSHLLDPAYIAQIRADLPDHAIASDLLRAGDPAPAKTPAPPPAAQEGHQTTQYSVVDAKGAAISVTYTLNNWYGAHVVAGKTGIVMNDEMDDFTAKPGVPNMFGIVGGSANAIAPGKTPLSSMAPSILSRDGRPVMVIGSPGGSRIPTIVLSVVLGAIDGHLDIANAITLPRLHEQWEPEGVEIEDGAITSAVRATLEGEGYRFFPHAPWGIAEGIWFDRKTGTLQGASDPRHGGGAAIAE